MYTRFISSSYILASVCMVIVAGVYEVNAQSIGIFDDQSSIGEVSAEGNASEDGDLIIVTANGSGIGGTEDQFHYVFKEMTGDFRLKANIFSFPVFGEESAMKSMIMVRQELTPQSTFYGPLVSGDLFVKTEWRSQSGEISRGVQGPSETGGTIEVMRANGQLSSFYYNTDGEKTLLHSTQDFFNGPVYVGFAVTSGTDDGSVADAEFGEIEEVPVPFSISRTLPQYVFNPGEPIENITIEAQVADGENADLAVTESFPAGWNVSNIEASQGNASTDDNNNIVWDAPNASGLLTLTYDLTPPDGEIIRGFLSGLGTDQTTTLAMESTTLIANGQSIHCRKLADGQSITIDGDPSDWPLDSFEAPALLPDVPTEDQFSNDATSNAVNLVPMTQAGDHFVFNTDKVLVSAAGQDSFLTEGDEDFQATTYVAWDDNGLYVLHQVTDTKIGLEHGLNGEPTGSYEVDGLSLWFDNDNNRQPASIQDNQNSSFDLQIDYSIGAALFEEEQPEGEIPPGLEIDIFRSALDTNDGFENNVLNGIDKATRLDDNPVGQHEGYVQEMFFPWEIFPSLSPDEPIGFNVVWNDWDDTIFTLMRWHQANESQVQYYRGMQFVSDNPLGNTVSVNEWSLY